MDHMQVKIPCKQNLGPVMWVWVCMGQQGPGSAVPIITFFDGSVVPP